MDDQLQRLRRRASAGDEEAEAELFVALRRAGREPTFDDLVGSRRWHKVVGVVRKWFVRPLEPRDGAKPAAIAAAERRLGVRLPDVLREWYTLVGNRSELPDAGHVEPESPALEGDRIIIIGGLNQVHFGARDGQVETRRRPPTEWQLRNSPGVAALHMAASWSPVGQLTPDFFAGLLLHGLATHYGAYGGLPERAHGGWVHAVTNETRDPGKESRLRAAIARRYERLDLPFTIPPDGSTRFASFSYELFGDADTVLAMLGGSMWTEVHAWTRTDGAWNRLRGVSRHGWGDVWQRGPRGSWRSLGFQP